MSVSVCIRFCPSLNVSVCLCLSLFVSVCLSNCRSLAVSVCLCRSVVLCRSPSLSVALCRALSLARAPWDCGCEAGLTAGWPGWGRFRLRSELAMGEPTASRFLLRVWGRGRHGQLAVIDNEESREVTPQPAAVAPPGSAAATPVELPLPTASCLARLPGAVAAQTGQQQQLTILSF